MAAAQLAIGRPRREEAHLKRIGQTWSSEAGIVPVVRIVPLAISSHPKNRPACRLFRSMEEHKLSIRVASHD